MSETITQQITIEKAWLDNAVTYVEGWLSTPALDTEKHVIEPEAFEGAIDSYFERCAPVSYVHERQSLPAGHLQKAAILRDGQIIKTSEHPTDKADFASLPVIGSGVYVRGAITEEVPARSIRLGNTGGFSFTAKATGEILPDGSKRFGKGSISHLIESTVAPYPKNPTTVLTLSKAENTMDETKLQETIEKALTEAVAKLTPAAPPVETLSKAEVETLIATERAAIKAEVEQELQKAQLTRGESAGRHGNISGGTEKNIIEELLQKAESGQQFTSMDDITLFKLTSMAISDGMKY